MKKKRITFNVNDYSEMETVELFATAILEAAKSVGKGNMSDYRKTFSHDLNCYLICQELEKRNKAEKLGIFSKN